MASRGRLPGLGHGLLLPCLLPVREALLAELVDWKVLLNAQALNSVGQGLMGIIASILGGSVLAMHRAVANAQAFTGLSLAEAVKMATLNPAKVLGPTDRKGQLTPGRDAALVIFNAKGQPWMTIVKGQIAWQG